MVASFFTGPGSDRGAHVLRGCGAGPLVSVIIPAFDAERTILATLESAAGQTYRDLEILVVDDGSRDNTPDMVADVARRDPRVRLITQANGGVARARNHGIAAARGTFVAPLDADDLWHPEKIERQVARMQEAGEDTGLVYGWFRVIDGEDRIVQPCAQPTFDGWVWHRHLALNFVSNGSSPLIRAAALERVRYDPGLADAGVGGCEDYLLQLEIAKDWRFACVPAFLTGYRKAGGSMSSNSARMIGSHIAVLERMSAHAGPEARAIIGARLARFHIEYARNRLRRREWREGAAALGQALRLDYRSVPGKLIEEAQLVLARAQPASGRPASPRFDAISPDQPTGRWQPDFTPEELDRLRRLDEDYGRGRGSDVRMPADARLVEPAGESA